MRKHLLLFFLIFPLCSKAQNEISFFLKDSTTHEPLFGATALILETKIGGVADIEGKIILKNIPEGDYEIEFRSVGYHTQKQAFHFPIKHTEIIVFLSPMSEILDEIIVEGTRSNRSIDDIPTRVEVLTEEIDEASTMDPSKVAHLLTHSTGIQVQQTSATSNMANVRIQGLDGRYCQILKDGFPIYGGFSGSLSVMQIPPLDLRQIEYVKGSSSTLYGAGAISGLINLISKEPILNKDEHLIHLNVSQVGAFDINAFTSHRNEKIGYTLLAQRNTHTIFDADNDGFSDLPQLTKFNFNPRLFIYFNAKNKMYVGATITSEERVGGDIYAIESRIIDSSHFYQENNDVNRITTQVKYDYTINEKSGITFKNSFNLFKREYGINPSPYMFSYFAGNQTSSFSELSFRHQKNKNAFITGINFYTDDFKEDQLFPTLLRDEYIATIGYFANYTFDIGEIIAIESGLRTDYTLENDLHILPRISALFKWTEKLTTRIGGGMGYRNPSIFNQEAELIAYQNVLPINFNATKAEESYGGNADIGYKTTFGEKFFLNFNQMFFYTRVDKPLVLKNNGNLSPLNEPLYEFTNANGYTESYGAETFFKFGFYDFVLFVGYTYTHVTNHFDDTVSLMTLTPQHSLKGDLLYALPGKWRIGADYEYKSGQLLNNGTTSPSFWTFGLVIEHTWKNFTFFGNVENYTNFRQTNLGSLVSSPFNTPQFTDVWAPLDGIVFNGGIKIRL